MAFDGTYVNGQPSTMVSPILQTHTINHSSDATKQYIGKAALGALTSESVWLIAEVTTTATSTVVKYASAAFDQELDERESLTYT